MRYRVDLPYGWASFDKRDWEKAKALYDAEGLRLRKTRDVFDDVGELVAGIPIGARLPVAKSVLA